MSKNKHREDTRAGLYMTIIFHLLILIVLLVAQIGFSLQHDNSFLLDFSKQEIMEKEAAETEFKEDISRRVEELLAASQAGQLNVRNVTVNRSALKDDRGTDAEELYKDAQKLADDLSQGNRVRMSDDYLADAPSHEVESPDKSEDKQYSGPSVVSYELGGRKASRLPIPSYRCYGGGMVTVIITVDNAGNVVAAKVQDEISTPDDCLRSFAVRAARLSRFSSDPKAPSRHVGNIVYQFIPQ